MDSDYVDSDFSDASDIEESDSDTEFGLAEEAFTTRKVLPPPCPAGLLGVQRCLPSVSVCGLLLTCLLVLQCRRLPSWCSRKSKYASGWNPRLRM